jgi:purine nucleosidase
MTNLALALRHDPSLPARVGTVYAFAGAHTGVGNFNLTAEFNVASDPEAAAEVLRAFRDIVLVPWETCVAQPLPDAAVAAWLCRRDGCDGCDGTDGTDGGDGDADGVSTAKLTPWAFLERVSRESIDKSAAMGGGYLIPDPLAMAVALRPHAVCKRVLGPWVVRVELAGTLTRGMTVVDRFGLMPCDVDDAGVRTVRAPNVRVVDEVHMDAVQTLLMLTHTPP